MNQYSIAGEISGRKIVLAVGIGCLMVGLIGLLVWNYTSGLVETNRWVDHTEQVLTEIESVRADLRGVDRWALYYLVTGQPEQRQLFRRAVGSLWSHIDRLQQMTADNRERQAQLSRLKREVSHQVRALQAAVDGFRGSREASAVNSLPLTATTGEWSVIRRILDEIENREQLLLEHRRGNAAAAAGTTAVLSATLLLSCLCIFGGLIASLYRNGRMRQQGESQLRSALAELRNSEEMIRMLVAGVQDYAIFRLDPSGFIVSWNEGGERIKGYSAEEILGSHFSRFYTPEDVKAGEPEAALRRAAEVDRFEQEGWRVRKDGSRFWADTIITALRGENGRLRGFAKITRDITERRALEDSLKAARDQAVEASRFKSAFLAKMSHEIRTPMNGIIGMINILQRTDLDERQREFLTTVRDAANSLVAIVNDVLDFSKVEAGKLSLEVMEFRPVAVVESIGDLLSTQARQQNVSLMTFVSPDVPKVLLGDPGRLRQVLLNLATNAIKFAAHGQVLVKAQMDDGAGELPVVKFTVTDTGIGMSDEQRLRLFQPFVQGNDSARFGGTGLGLAISKSLVELMGGQISVESTPGHGSTFWFSVPFHCPKTETLRRPVGPNLTGLRVLVVDDEPLARDTIKSYLTSWNMHAAASSSAADGLAAMRQAYVDGEPFDLAIIDLVMPGKDGIELGRSVLQDPRIRDTKMILITACDAPGIGEQSMEHGFSCCLWKPVRQSQLLDCIATITNRSGPQPDAWQVAAWKADSVGRQADTVLVDTSKTVLVVEDNRVNQQVALLELKQLGLHADAVGNGQEAIEALKRASYGIVLMDCQMPEMDGYEATRKIREDEAQTGRHIPIIAMTAHAMAGDQDRCLEAGMDGYISKPIDNGRLVGILARWIPRFPVGKAEPAGGGAAAGPAGSDGDGEVEMDCQCPLIDYEYLKNEFGTGEALNLLRLFKSSCETLDKGIAAAAENRDTAALRSALHELKGCSSSLRAEKLHTLVVQVQLLVQQDDWDGLEGCMAKLRDVLTRTIDSVDDIIARQLDAD